ncbi:MAG: tRNA1(Val) (adenine(37)-N6)-methyltransferase [Prevotellaceae bacterium]|jgi:tRNA1Val (adenine37-N6)-methyltransferase|nr:tRNA1(Val) (adenine(37)-N6)-methyltransferase [Prevotellaceae bacterium]
MTPASPLFHFKQFSVAQQSAAMKVNTDGVLLGAWADAANARRILDVGTGVGVIALMLAQRNAAARIDAVEIDERSAQLARENVQNSPWSDRITVYGQSFQSFAAQGGARYDLVVSNPPYFVNALLPPSEARTLARHAGELPHEELLSGAKKILQSGGALCVVLPLSEGTAFIERAAAHRLFCLRQTTVYSKAGKPPKRLLLHFSDASASAAKDTLVIHQDGGGYTPKYKTIIMPFLMNNEQ